MGAYSYDASLGYEVLNGGDGRTDTGIVSDGLSVKGNVNIATYKNSLSLKLVISEVSNGLLGLELDLSSEGASKTLCN